MLFLATPVQSLPGLIWPQPSGLGLTPSWAPERPMRKYIKSWAHLDTLHLLPECKYCGSGTHLACQYRNMPFCKHTLSNIPSLLHVLSIAVLPCAHLAAIYTECMYHSVSLLNTTCSHLCMLVPCLYIYIYIYIYMYRCMIHPYRPTMSAPVPVVWQRYRKHVKNS